MASKQFTLRIIDLASGKLEPQPVELDWFEGVQFPCPGDGFVYNGKDGFIADANWTYKQDRYGITGTCDLVFVDEEVDFE